MTGTHIEVFLLHLVLHLLWLIDPRAIRDLLHVHNAGYLTLSATYVDRVLTHVTEATAPIVLLPIQVILN